MRTQMEKAELFRALHERPGAFIIPNPWDAGTAKLLAAMGFEALATTSLGLANTLGSATVSRNAIIENCRAIAQATELPVNADLENCGADEPKAAAETIRLAAEAGVVGGSIEDATGDPRRPITGALRFSRISRLAVFMLLSIQTSTSAKRTRSVFGLKLARDRRSRKRYCASRFQASGYLKNIGRPLHSVVAVYLQARSACPPNEQKTRIAIMMSRRSFMV